MATTADSQIELSIIMPFLKLNPFDDYVVVDTSLKSAHTVSLSD